VSFPTPKTDFYVYTSFSPNVYVVNAHMCVCAYTCRSLLYRVYVLCIHVCMGVRIVYARVCVFERIHMEVFFPAFKHGDGGQLLETPWSISYYIYKGEKVQGICPLIIGRRHSDTPTRVFCAKFSGRPLVDTKVSPHSKICCSRRRGYNACGATIMFQH